MQAETARVVWSFSRNDPEDSLGETAQFHAYEGSVSINLLGGLSNPPNQPDNMEYFDLTVTNVCRLLIIILSSSSYSTNPPHAHQI